MADSGLSGSDSFPTNCGDSETKSNNWNFKSGTEYELSEKSVETPIGNASAVTNRQVNNSKNSPNSIVETLLPEHCYISSHNTATSSVKKKIKCNNSTENLIDKTPLMPMEVDTFEPSCFRDDNEIDINRQSFHNLMLNANESLVQSHDLVMEECSVRSVASVGLLNSLNKSCVSEINQVDSLDDGSSLSCLCIVFRHCWFE